MGYMSCYPNFDYVNVSILYLKIPGSVVDNTGSCKEEAQALVAAGMSRGILWKVRTQNVQHDI
jgi:hypothetical protein